MKKKKLNLILGVVASLTRCRSDPLQANPARSVSRQSLGMYELLNNLMISKHMKLSVERVRNRGQCGMWDTRARCRQ